MIGLELAVACKELDVERVLWVGLVFASEIDGVADWQRPVVHHIGV